VPAEVSLENFKQQHQDDPDILAAIEEVGANPIGDSLEISAQHPEDFDFILKALDTSPEFAPYIREKSFANHQAVIDQLSAFNNKVRWGGLVLATFFALISILIVFNTIRVAIYVHRDEIAVMKLVGAKDWFIRSPFLLESILYSAAATAVVAGVMALLLNFFDPKIRLFFAGIDVDLPGYYWQHVFSVFGLQFVLLAILTMITTTLAMRRYLRT
jgi:cell division transport system permease protein